MHNISWCCQGCDTLLFLLSDTKIEVHVSVPLSICSWKSAHLHNLNLAKTECFFSCSPEDLSLTSDMIIAQAPKIYNRLSCEGQTAVTTWSCRVWTWNLAGLPDRKEIFSYHHLGPGISWPPSSLPHDTVSYFFKLWACILSGEVVR